MVSLADKRIYGKELIKDFIKLFTSYSISNRTYARFMLHVIIGQICRNVYFRVGARKIDARIHLLLFQASGTGKGAGYGISTDFMEELGKIVHKITFATDAALIGTVEYDHSTKEMVPVDGLLKDADFLCMEEANIIFDKQTQHTQNTPVYIQVACNPHFDTSSHIEKKLARGEMIKLEPKCSFVLLTYKPVRLLEAIVQTGLIQRFITVIRDVGLEERRMIIRRMFDILNISTVDEYDNFHVSVLDRLKTIKKLYGGHPKQMNFTDDAKENLYRISMEFTDMILDTSTAAKLKLEEFVHRLSENLIRISIHHAILRLSEQVEVKDTAYAKQVMMPVWSNLVAYIEVALIEDEKDRAKFMKYIRDSVDIYKDILRTAKKPIVKDDWVRRRSLVEKLCPLWNDISYTSASKEFKLLEKKENEKDPRAWFVVKKIGSTEYVKLLRDLS